jgi:hypothetical protein
MRNRAERWYARMLARARHAQHIVSQSPRRWGALGIVICLALLLSANLKRFRQWMNERHLAVHPEAAPSLAAALWYQRLLKWLGRQGWNKTHVQTPQEFLTCIEDPLTRKRVESFTRAYEAARFGDSSDEARRLPELYEEITTAEDK